MAVSVYSSGYLSGLFDAGDVGRLFTDSAEIRALLLVEGALAKVQGSLGVIPELSGQAIHRASLEIQIDPGGLNTATAQNGVVIPALVAAFREAMQAPEHSQFVHWGATSQDIIDTGLMLRMRQVLGQCDADLKAILNRMAQLAETHADTPMLARTWGQQATPTSWGAVVAQWGEPLVSALMELERLRTETLWVSLSGATGTSSALGPQVAETRAGLARALGLADPGRSWHTDRAPILRIAQWMGRVCAALAAIGKSTALLASSEVAEIDLGASGGSSTMPQKQNPVLPSLLVALHAQVTASMAGLQASSEPSHQRDGASWMGEWISLPQIVLGTATALGTARRLVQTMEPRIDRMMDAIDAGQGFAFAEALSFALAHDMPRPDAQAKTKALIAAARDSGHSLESVARSEVPGLDPSVFDAAGQMGTAGNDARDFARKVQTLT